jgi:Uri superfamily endonuclease
MTGSLAEEAAEAALPAPEKAPDNHLYVILTYVPRRTGLRIGHLGIVTLQRGWYAYVGSAAVARRARVARHLRAEKALRWHADYLLQPFTGRGAWLLDSPLRECELVDELVAGTGASRAVARFGAGDCRCAGHLLRLPARRAADRRLLALGARRFRTAPARRADHRDPAHQ